MDKNQYLANILALSRSLATNDPITQDLVPISGASLKCKEVDICFSLGTMKLMFQYGNLYLQGFKNKNGELFLFKNSGYNGGGVVSKQFQQETDYLTLGWDRNSSITVSLNDLDNALNTLYNANAANVLVNNLKKPMLYCAVGFSEALRFQDVALAVMNGTAIDPGALDWSKRTKNNDYKVRVKAP